MKKIYTLVITGALCGSMFAQQGALQTVAPIGTQSTNAIGHALPVHISRLMVHPSSATSTGSRWYNYGEACDVHNSGVNPGTGSTINPDFLFPDTTILANFGTTVGTPFIHYLGDVFDPKSSYYNTTLYAPTSGGPAVVVSKTDSYTIDSVSVVIGYTRNTPAGIVDTLVVEIGRVPNSAGTYYYPGSGPGTPGANLGTDTVFFKGIQWYGVTKSLQATGKQVYKVLLTAATVADTLSNGLHVVNIACTGLAAFPANSLAAASVTFKPGYTWVANTDNMSLTKNVVNFESYQETSSFPSAYQKKDYNCSFTINNKILYSQDNSALGGYDSLYIPSFAYEGNTTPFPFEHHLIYYHVQCTTCSMVSTNDIKLDGFSIGDSYPNPVNQGTEIVLPINLDVKAKATIVVYDILGKQIGVALEENNLNTGNNEVRLNTRNLQPGIYSVSVTVGSKVKSMRVVVTR
jgi:hypothetical protein